MADRITFEATVNGQKVGPLDIPADLMLTELLHEYLGLTGTRVACGQGVCRACSVLIDDGVAGSAAALTPLPACVTGAAYASGKSIRTIEGMAGDDGQGNPVPSAIQQAFLDHFSFQCSFCTPGFVISAQALVERLERAPVPRDQVEDTVLAAMNENICRCTGYVRYLGAVRDVVLNTPGLTTGDPEPAVTAAAGPAAGGRG
ncbi:(2Fe-2S)-binding protein [Paracoccus marinus]|uniref:(2Fe-2S)-binding protein n=1 Tax=Paracoccus marinus TaxID=288426 RepID=UPI0010397ADE|nr:(2Fe-2S)-binding protein [Paracoccus marinus]